MEVFLNPAHHAEQMPWVRDARRCVSRDLRQRIEEFRFFLEPSVETFAFTEVDSSSQTLASELEALGSDEGRYVDAVVKRLSGARLFRPDDMERIRRPRWYRKAAAEHVRSQPQSAAMLSVFLASPSRSLRSFCDVIAEFYNRAIEHRWGSISQCLLEDIRMRRRILKERGAAAVLRTLSPSITIHGGRQGMIVDVSGGSSEMRMTDASALLLTPSFFCWPHTQALFLKAPGSLRCIITYALPPLPTRSRRLDNPRVLVKLLEALGDSTRLRIVELLRERDLSTRELAGFLKLSESVVSRHLRRLLQCGLVDQKRSGYFVMYRLAQPAMKQLTQSLSVLA